MDPLAGIPKGAQPLGKVAKEKSVKINALRPGNFISIHPMSIEILPGFREFYPETCFERNFIFEKMRQVCQNFCFTEYDSPILEPLELFTEKSGEEIAVQLFNFVDRGGRAVALRPEMTPAVARMIGSKIHTLKRPLKWFSIEENFRYERPQKGRLRSFYQLNVDIFDEKNIHADAEIIALAITILRSFGLTVDDFHVRLSDRNLWTLLLHGLAVPENLITNVLSIVDKMERESRDEIMQKLNAFHLDSAQLLENIATFQTIRTVDDLEKFLQAILKKSDEEVVLRLGQLRLLLARLKHFGLASFVTLDFSIVRGLAYYTGFVFEIFERSGKSRALAGGGRYDDLIEKFGYSKTAAVGLAIGDVTLGNVLADRHLIPTFDPIADLFIVFDPQSEAIAMGDAYDLRSRGFSVNYVLKDGLSIDKHFKQAIKARWVAQYTDNQENIILRNIAQRKDYPIHHFEIISFL
ncbi:MAG: ATP phosphoribosyltransferase regulatory subunit [Puniceicoccales bacterium]|jgi:histidyl-tRNA synthetase|nr:ATP phosphoribosyltransferase regulatory subunit [Puniceicoccales bacterium]